MGILYTFYSYKGGVGRSMALANVAALLSSWGHSVLAIDWDLEAPGLEKYFMKEPSLIEGSRTERPGVVDLVTAFESKNSLDWEECLLGVYPYGKAGSRLDLISAGQDTHDYVPKLQSIEWRRLFEKGFGAYLEGLRDEWLLKYDFVLVDSRTGITDIGGVCTIHLPDILVVLFTANEQSLDGVLDVVERANSKFDKLPDEYERPPKLLCVPVPSRFEYFTEYESAARWLKKFAERLRPVYADWLPPTVTPEAVLEKLFIPNIPFWSFGEGLPVVQEGTSNPRSLGFAYELLAKVVKHRLQWNEALRGDETITEDSSPEVINQVAERAFRSLSSEDAWLAQRVLAKLVQVAPSPGHDARRRAALSDFDSLEQGLIIALVETRLLSVTQQDGEGVVEIARDETLRYWERLRNWLDADREFLLWRQKLGTSISDWNNGKQESSYLLKGGALETAKKFAHERTSELKPAELGYIYGSNTEEVRGQRRERLRRTVVLTVLVLAFTVGGLFAYRSYKAQQASKAQELAFNRAVLSTSKGIDKFTKGDYEGAIEDYNAALRDRNDYDAAYLNRGEAYLTLANSPLNLDKAEKDKLRALAVSDFRRAATLTTDDATRKTAQQYANDAQNPSAPIQDPTPTPTPTPQSTPSPSASPRITPTPTASPQPSPLPSPVLVLVPRVYIQSLDNDSSRKGATDCQVMLAKLGYTVTLSIVKDVPTFSEIRYYRKNDAKEADQINMSLHFTTQPRYLPGFENSPAVRPRHFEVWLGLK